MFSFGFLHLPKNMFFPPQRNVSYVIFPRGRKSKWMVFFQRRRSPPQEEKNNKQKRKKKVHPPPPWDPYAWVNYNDLTRPRPKWWFMWGIATQPLYFRLVKYCNSPRYPLSFGLKPRGVVLPPREVGMSRGARRLRLRPLGRIHWHNNGTLKPRFLPCCLRQLFYSPCWL